MQSYKGAVFIFWSFLLSHRRKMINTFHKSLSYRISVLSPGTAIHKAQSWIEQGKTAVACFVLYVDNRLEPSDFCV